MQDCIPKFANSDLPLAGRNACQSVRNSRNRLTRWERRVEGVQKYGNEVRRKVDLFFALYVLREEGSCLASVLFPFGVRRSLVRYFVPMSTTFISDDKFQQKLLREGAREVS